MKTRTKTILIYLSGLFTGIVLSVAFVFITLWQTASSQYDKIVIFDKPQQELKEKVFDVFQVLPNGNALANSDPRMTPRQSWLCSLQTKKCPSTTHKESLSLAASVSCKLASTNTTQIKELKKPFLFWKSEISKTRKLF